MVTLYGSGADRRLAEAVDPDLEIVFLRHHQADIAGQLARDVRVGRGGLDLDGVGAGGLDPLEAGGEGLAARLERLRPPQPVGAEGEGDVLGRHVRAVVELHALAQLDGPDRAVPLPLRRQLWLQRQAIGVGEVVALDQRLIEVREDPVRGGAEAVDRRHRLPQVVDRDGQHRPVRRPPIAQRRRQRDGAGAERQLAETASCEHRSLLCLFRSGLRRCGRAASGPAGRAASRRRCSSTG